MNNSILDKLLANALAQEVLRYIDLTGNEALIERADHHAITLLGQIKDSLDNPALNDSECFHPIDTIADAFFSEDIITRRHEDV